MFLPPYIFETVPFATALATQMLAPSKATPSGFVPTLKVPRVSSLALRLGPGNHFEPLGACPERGLRAPCGHSLVPPKSPMECTGGDTCKTVMTRRGKRLAPLAGRHGQREGGFVSGAQPARHCGWCHFHIVIIGGRTDGNRYGRSCSNNNTTLVPPCRGR
jgi:hypothetical protein